MHISFDIKQSLHSLIMNTKELSRTFSIKHPNSKYHLSTIIDDILYVLKTGISWRNLRSSINWHTVLHYYNLFVKFNIFEKLFKLFRKRYIHSFLSDSNVTLLIDSTIIYNRYGRTKLGRNKFYKNKRCSKLSLLTDQHGIPLSIFLIKGNYHDNSTFVSHINDAIIMLKNKKLKVLADKGYSSKLNYQLLDSKNITHIIPPTKNMKLHSTYTYSKDEYKKRIKIENIFAYLKKFRRIDCRYDKFVKNYKGFLYLSLSFCISNIVHRIY